MPAKCIEGPSIHFAMPVTYPSCVTLFMNGDLWPFPSCFAGKIMLN